MGPIIIIVREFSCSIGQLPYTCYTGVSDNGSQVHGKNSAVLVALHRSTDVLRVLLLEDHRGTASHRQGRQRDTLDHRQSERAAYRRDINLRN